MFVNINKHFYLKLVYNLFWEINHMINWEQSSGERERDQEPLSYSGTW